MNYKNEYENRVALITEYEEEIIYSRLRDESDRIAACIRKRSLCIIICSNTYECIAGYVGCISNRIVPMMLSYKVDICVLNNIIMSYKPQVLWIPKEILEKNKDKINFNKIIYELKKYVLININDYNTNINDNLALLLSTSGSTGSRKFVRLSYKNIEENTKSIVEALNIKKEDKTITLLPLNYTYELSVINTHLYSGATIIVTNEPIYKNKFWKMLNEYKVNSISGVPYTYEMLIKLKLLNNIPTFVKKFMLSGGCLDISYQKIINDYTIKNNIDFFSMYGQTEATARITCMKSDNEHIGSMGKFIPNVSGKILDNGELVVYGENISMGYAYSYKDMEKGDENKGILHTGDIVEMDIDGYFYWKGRLDRNKKVLGHRINLDEFDEILRKKYENKFFVSNIIKDSIIINTDLENHKELIEYVIKLTNFNKQIFIINDMDSLPRKENGKVDYLDLLNKNEKLLLYK